MPTPKVSAFEMAVDELATHTLACSTLVRSAAGMTAVNCVLLTYVVAICVVWVPKSTVAVAAKFVPVNVIVRSGLPATATFGEIFVSVGTRLGDAVIVNGRKFETVLSGFRTKTFTVVGVVKSAAGTVAVSCVLDPKVVVRTVPSHTIWLPLTKPVPTAVRGRSADPVTALDGLIDVNVGGVPLPPPVPPVIVKGNVPFDVVVSGFNTPILTVPPALIMSAVIDAVN